MKNSPPDFLPLYPGNLQESVTFTFTFLRHSLAQGKEQKVLSFLTNHLDLHLF